MKRRRFRRRQPAQSRAAAAQDPGIGPDENVELPLGDTAEESAETADSDEAGVEESIEDRAAPAGGHADTADEGSTVAGPESTDGDPDGEVEDGPAAHEIGRFSPPRAPAKREIRGGGYTGAGSTRPADPMAQARELEQAGQVDRAMNLFREILRRDPDNLEAHFGLGSLYEKIGQHLQALEQFEMAKRVDPENVDAAVRHAKAMATLGRYDAAERDLRRAARIDPNRPEVFTTLGMIGVRRGLYEQAEQDLKRAIELSADSAAAYHYRGEALNQLGRVDEALAMLEQAARLDPTNPRTFYVMGIVLDKKQRPQEAGAMFRRSRELTPG